MTKDKFFIIDFDSTLTQVETFEELANISLKNNPRKHEIIDEINEEDHSKLSHPTDPALFVGKTFVCLFDQIVRFLSNFSGNF